MILDTNVLIKLEREARRGFKGPASDFLSGLGEMRFCITPTIAGEFCCGGSMAERELWEEALAPYELLEITRETSWIYGKQYRHLAMQGQLIGTNDLWIAATALAHALPIATGNVSEFSRISELEVIAV